MMMGDKEGFVIGRERGEISQSGIEHVSWSKQ